jgi:hypothetical protein
VSGSVTMFDVTMFDVTMFDVTMFDVTMFDVTMFDVTMFDVVGLGCCHADLSERSSSTQSFTNRVGHPDESILPIRCYCR